MDKVVNITPFDQVKITTVASMTVRVMRVELFKGATLHISLLDTNGVNADSKIVEINGDDYKRWGGDDTFIYEYIANKLGFTMPDVVAPPPATAPIIFDPLALAPPPVMPMQEFAPTPVEESAPTPVEESAPTPVEESAPTPVEESAPTPVEESAPTPVEEPAPTPVEEPAPTPTDEPAPTPE
jgi:hypothetical protein